MEYQRLKKSKILPIIPQLLYQRDRLISTGMPGLIEGTNTICFIDNTDLPVNRWMYVKYGIVVVDYTPEKSDPYRTRIKVGGDRSNHPGDCGTTTVDLTTVKILLNIIVSTPN